MSEFETLAELRESLETRLQKEAEQKTRQSKQEALLDKLVEQLEADLPETLLKREVDHSVTQTAMRFAQQGMDVKKTFTQDIVSMLRDQARPEALSRLKRTLAMGEIAKQESLSVEAEAVEAKVAEMLIEYAGQDVDEDRLREAVEEDLLREKIFDWLEAHNSIELVPEGSLTPAEPEAAESLDAASATVDVNAIAVEAGAVEAVAIESEPDLSPILPTDASPAESEAETSSEPEAPEPEVTEPEVEAIAVPEPEVIEPKATKAAKSSGKSDAAKKSKSSKPSA